MFSPEGASKANDFLCSSILAVLLTHNFYIKTILLSNIFYGKNRLLLLASIKYCYLFLGNSYLLFAKITRVVISGLRSTT